MKAYIAQFEGEDWITFVHGETQGKAKSRFLTCNPAGPSEHGDWNFIRVYRLPEWDDRPFVECEDLMKHYEPDHYDDHGDPVYETGFIRDCNCPICQPLPHRIG